MRSIDFLLSFFQAGIDLDVFIKIPLGMEVDGNRGKWFLKLNKSMYRLKQSSANWFDPLLNGLEIRFYHQY